MSKRVSKKENWFKENNFTAKDEIYVGVDVHNRHYHVAIWHSGRIGCVYSMIPVISLEASVELFFGKKV